MWVTHKLQVNNMSVHPLVESLRATNLVPLEQNSISREEECRSLTTACAVWTVQLLQKKAIGPVFGCSGHTATPARSKAEVANRKLHNTTFMIRQPDLSRKLCSRTSYSAWSHEWGSRVTTDLFSHRRGCCGLFQACYWRHLSHETRNAQFETWVRLKILLMV